MELMQDNPATEESSYKQDIYLTLAFQIAKGEAGDYMYCLQDGKFYTYELGVWREILLIEFVDRISNKILNAKGQKVITTYDIVNRKKILENFKLLKYLPLSSFNATHMINLENYMFDPLGINVVAHKKEYYSTIRIPYKYDGLSKCDLWIKTLSEILEDDEDKINVLQEFMGCCLTRDTRMEKALLLLGESRSGKSTILNTLQYMVGDANCSHVPLMNLENPQYTSMMINKLVNIDGEVSKKAADFESQFKTIVTGHEVNCNDKYMPPFNFRPFCKFVMSANEFPKITDHSSAFYKRLILIPCNRVFETHEQNRNLREELLKELPGILNWSIEGLKRLNERGMFEEKEFIKDAVEELQDENNPVNEFFKEYIEVVMGKELEKGFIYDKYRIWSKETENYVFSKAKFSTILYKKYCKYTPKDTNSAITGKRVWKNLRYIDKKQTSQPVDYQE